MQGECAGKYGNMNFFAETDHGGAYQCHQMLAADQSTQAANVGVEDLEIGCVTLAPKQPLGEGRHGLAVPAHEVTGAIESRRREL